MITFLSLFSILSVSISSIFSIFSICINSFCLSYQFSLQVFFCHFLFLCLYFFFQSIISISFDSYFAWFYFFYLSEWVLVWEFCKYYPRIYCPGQAHPKVPEERKWFKRVHKVCEQNILYHADGLNVHVLFIYICVDKKWLCFNL